MSTDVTFYMTMQTLAEAISPPSGDGLGRYLDAVVHALGVQTDAGLARLMDISPTIVASWRRRQVVTKSASIWLVENMIRLVAEKQSYRFGLNFEGAAVLEVLRRTQVDPLGIGHNNQMNCEAIPPLLTLASIIFQGSLLRELDDDDNRDIRVADLLMEALPALRKRLTYS